MHQDLDHNRKNIVMYEDGAGILESLIYVLMLSTFSRIDTNVSTRLTIYLPTMRQKVDRAILLLTYGADSFS